MISWIADMEKESEALIKNQEKRKEIARKSKQITVQSGRKNVPSTVEEDLTKSLQLPYPMFW